MKRTVDLWDLDQQRWWKIASLTGKYVQNYTVFSSYHYGHATRAWLTFRDVLKEKEWRSLWSISNVRMIWWKEIITNWSRHWENIEKWILYAGTSQWYNKRIHTECTLSWVFEVQISKKDSGNYQMQLEQEKSSAVKLGHPQ